MKLQREKEKKSEIECCKDFFKIFAKMSSFLSLCNTITIFSKKDIEGDQSIGGSCKVDFRNVEYG